MEKFGTYFGMALAATFSLKNKGLWGTAAFVVGGSFVHYLRHGLDKMLQELDPLISYTIIPGIIALSAMFLYHFLRAPLRLDLENAQTAIEDFSKKQQNVGGWVSFEMPDFNAWSKLDEYSLIQAACLWAEVEPVNHPMSMLPQVQPFYEMLTQGIRSKKIPAHIQYEYGSTRKTTEPKFGVIIKRADLESLAKEREEKPKFLFPDQETNPHGWMAR